MEFATGALGSLLPKLAQLLHDEYNLQKSVRKDVQFLMGELESMQVALRKVGEVQPEQLDEQVRIWAHDVRELSYDMEDIVDSFLVRVDSSDPESSRGFMNKMIELFSKGRTRHQMAQEIKDIRDRVKDIAERRDRYRVDTINPATTMMDPRITTLYTKVSDLVGIEKTKDDIISKLTEGNSMSTNQQKVVSIVGFGGLGKTTLAKAVYDKIKRQFNCTAFVSVSRSPDMKKVFKDMLYELDKKEYGDIHSTAREEKHLIDLLLEFLSDKRYFIVLDDIWDIQPWKTIRCALDENNLGSAIITTTRNIDVAEKIGGSYRLKPLTHENSKTLFHGRIFGSEDKCPAQFSEVSEKILKKCGGVPLAITALSSLLANKPTNIADWFEVYDSIGSGLETDPNMNDMRKILLLSYYDLPSHLKTCLLYLSIFPEDYEIRMDRVVLRWVAEGFVQQGKRGDSLFRLGESYFNELCNRSMIQAVQIDDEGMSCRVHDMVLDLICSMAREENFVTTLEDFEQKALIRSNVRRISLRDTTRATTTNMSHVRSFTIFSPEVDSVPSLSCFHVLRVLDLEGCHFSDSAGLNLKYLGNLVQLRYLGLRDTKGVGELPAEIGKLQFLQTLDMAGTEVEELPPNIIQLGRLMCLRVDYCTTLPTGIGKLTLLEEVSPLLMIGSLDIVEELGGLTKLRLLRIRLRKPSVSFQEALVESLRKLCNIQTLDIYLEVDYGDHSHKLDVLGDTLMPPQQLHEFRAVSWSSFYSPLQLLPAWLHAAAVPHLAVLVIQVMKLRQEDVDTLGRLPALRVLCLEPCATCELLTVGSGAFPSLTVCRFRESNIAPVFEQGAMPCVRSLEFQFRVRDHIDLGDTGFEFGLENLAFLEEVTVCVAVHDAREPEVQPAEEALRRAESTHPNHATFDVITFGEELMCFDDDDDDE